MVTGAIPQIIQQLLSHHSEQDIFRSMQLKFKVSFHEFKITTDVQFLFSVQFVDITGKDGNTEQFN